MELVRVQKLEQVLVEVSERVLALLLAIALVLMLEMV